MSKVLITGGLGNLGSWLTDYLLQNTDMEVYVLSSKPDYYPLSRPYHLLTADVSDLEALKSCLMPYSFDYVYHLASVNDTFVADYDHLAYRINVVGTQNIVKVLASHPIKKFVYLSTFHVYGSQQGQINENTECKAPHSYGSTHLEAEKIVAAHFEENRYAIFRLSNSYGCPRLSNNNKWYLVLNDLCRQAFTNQKIQLLSNGKPTRDFIWMGDVCDILHQSISHPELNGIFNLNSGQLFSMYQIAERVQKAYQHYSGQTILIALNDEDTKAHTSDWYLSNEKLQKVISFSFHNKIESEAIRVFERLEKDL
jgi:UDP-glucose 4-epimerase